MNDGPLHRLMNRAAFEMLKLGHRPKMWRPVKIAVSRQRRVPGLLTQCSYCGGEVQVATALQKQLDGEILGQPCMLNTGYEDRVVEGPYNEPCALLVRLNHDRADVYTRVECQGVAA